MALGQFRRSRAPAPSVSALAVLLVGLFALRPSLLFTPTPAGQKPQRGHGVAKPTGQKATATAAEVGVNQEVQALKEQLRRHPTKATVIALERLTRTPAFITDIVQLQGEWDLRGPKDNSAQGWLTGDVPRILLDLYSGDIGRMLSMELVEAPIIHISKDGLTSTTTQLRWGIQRDEITLQNKLKIVGPNKVRQTPRAVKSSALKMTLPLLQPSADIRFTYYDGDLLIARDGRGIVDVLWRRGGGRLLSSGPREEEEPEPQEPEQADPEADEADPEPEEADEPEEPVELEEPEALGEGAAVLEWLEKYQSPVWQHAGLSDLSSVPEAADTTAAMEEAEEESLPAEAQVEHLLNEVERLKETLEIQRQEAAEAREQRGRLLTEVASLEGRLDEAKVASEADSVTLGALEEITGRASKVTQDQREKHSQVSQASRQLSDEVAGLETEAMELQTRLDRYETHEETLRGEITMLQKELAEGPRAKWPAYRAALQKARDQLRDVRHELRSTKKEVSNLQRGLRKKSLDLERKAREATAEEALKSRLEERLQEQTRELLDQQGKLSVAQITEQELRAELDTLRAELKAVEAREANGLTVAAAVEGEMGEVVAQVSEVRKVAKSIGVKKIAKKFWPFR